MSKSKIDIPTIEEMLEAGVHFGHRTRRRNPLMDPYVYAVDKKTQIIDVFQTQKMLKEACDFLHDVAKSGKQIVIVGTKRQASLIVEKVAEECGALFVSERWLGGTFTNYGAIKKNWKELQSLVEKRDKGEFKHYTKKEQLLIDRKINKLNLLVGGIQDMEKYPGAVVVVDINREKTVVREARAVNVPIVGLVDTNSDPRNIEFLVPGNDDAIKSIKLFLRAISSAIAKGYAKKPAVEEKKAAPPVKEKKDEKSKSKSVAVKKATPKTAVKKKSSTTTVKKAKKKEKKS